MSPYIDVQNVSYSYDASDPTFPEAVSGVSFSVDKGSHVAVLGRNGSGKSTLARLINALELPREGLIVVDGWKNDTEEDIWSIRRHCGMVFQNPDNQIVATTVEEDVAFGPENLGLPSEEIVARVEAALAYTGLSDFAQKMPTELSGGQKQKLAIAGILAMRPDCLILDEATSMLDPMSRQSFLDLVFQMQRDHGITVINITHEMKEVLAADRVVVLDKGKLVMQGTPVEVFCQADEIRALGLDLPFHIAIADCFFRLKGLRFPDSAAQSPEGARAAILSELSVEPVSFAEQAAWLAKLPPFPTPFCAGDDEKPLIEVKGLSYRYDQEKSASRRTLEDINFSVFKGELLGIMGHSGSGKSTLVQHLNGLLRIQEGELRVAGYDLSKVKDIKALRRQVGLLFQYPEHQLFAATVREDIAFGPTRMGVAADEIAGRIEEAMQIVALPMDILNKSPFELSGGQKRRVAIAGILAMKPQILILDEPAAGLDPTGRDEILGYVRRLREEAVTVILVSHSMEDLARLADRILVLNEGRQVMLDSARHIFCEQDLLQRYQMTKPAGQVFLESLLPDLPELDVYQYSARTAVRAIVSAWPLSPGAEGGKA